MKLQSSGLTFAILIMLWQTALFGAAPQTRPVLEDFSWNLKAPQDLQIEAEQMTSFDEGNHVHLSGNVHVIGENIDIRSDEADLFHKEERTIFFGNVRVADGKRLLLGERLELDRQASKVLVKQAVMLTKKDPFSLTSDHCASAVECESIGRNNLSLRGQQMVRENDHYLIDRLRFTTCDCNGGTPSWEIRASSADILPNERVWMMWPILYAKGLPVFLLPVAYLPLSQRRTGLLFPLVNYSGRDGVVLSESLFVTLGQSADTTFSLDWFQERGFHERLEFRVRPSITSGLEMRLGFGQDKKAILKPVTLIDGTTVTPKNKLRLSGELNTFADFSPQTAFRTVLRLYSDSDLVRDFRSDMAGRAAEEAPSQFALWQRGMQTLWAFDAVYHQDLRYDGEKLFSDQTPWPMKPSDTIHRLGAVSFALAPISLPDIPLRMSLELEAANYSSFSAAWRNWGKDGLPDSLVPHQSIENDPYLIYDGENDGRLSAGELRRAVRLMTKPTVDIPVRLGHFLELEGRLFHRQFIYLPTGPGAPDPFTRGLSYASLKASSELTRSFGDQRQIGHLISPFVQVAGAWPGLSNVASPQFFDWQDRLQQHAVQLLGGFETSLYLRGSKSIWSKIINVSLFQGVDLERGRPAQITGLLKFEQAPLTFELILGGNWEKHLIVDVEATLNLQAKSGHALRVAYLYLPSYKDQASTRPVPLAERTQQEDGLPFGLSPLPERSIGDSLHVADVSGKLQIFDSFSITAGANFDLIPLANKSSRLAEYINWYGGGIAYNSSCHCFGCSLSVRMLRGQTYPDVFLWLDLGVLGSGGASSMNMF